VFPISGNTFRYNKVHGDSYNMYMDGKLPSTEKEELRIYLDSLTPLELAAHNARVSAYMLANLILVEDVIDAIEEVEALRNSDDVEERALLPVAELGLTETIALLPSHGEA